MLKQTANHAQQSVDQEPPRSRFWVALSAWVVVIVLVVLVGGALRNVLETPASTSPSSDPPAVIYVTLPPTVNASMDLPPITPVPVSTVIPAGAQAPYPQPAANTRAVKLLAQLPIKATDSSKGYSRSKFGPAWPDLDHNGCDTRNDILHRDLSKVVLQPSHPACVVDSGELVDPYSTNKISFRHTIPGSVQIDQVVSLADAWQKGAQRLSAAQRLAFANDPLNLIAVESMTSVSKGSRDASSWLPSNDSYRCKYVARQISVKATYGLWLSQIEHDVLAAVLLSCPDIQVPTDQHPVFPSRWPEQSYPGIQQTPLHSPARPLPVDEPSASSEPTSQPKNTPSATPSWQPTANPDPSPSSDPSVSTMITPQCKPFPDDPSGNSPVPWWCPSPDPTPDPSDPTADPTIPAPVPTAPTATPSPTLSDQPSPTGSSSEPALEPETEPSELPGIPSAP